MAARRKGTRTRKTPLAKPGLRRKLSRAEKVMIQEQFTHAKANVSDQDVERLVKRGVKETEALSRATPGWKVNLAAQVKLLFTLVRDWWRDRAEFPRASALAAVGALLYFVNPLDVVPDLVPFAGLLDDATVIAACIRLIQSDLRTYCEDRGLDLDAYGL